MPVKIVDASALGALVFGEPRAEEISRALEGSPVAAPALIWFELASICLRKMKSHPTHREKILAAMSLARRLPIEILAVEHEAVVDLADKTGLTTYDASYLRLARHLEGELITLDRKMRKAAGI